MNEPLPICGRAAFDLAKLLRVEVLFGNTVLLDPERDERRIEELLASGNGARIELDVGEAAIAVGVRAVRLVRSLIRRRPMMAVALLQSVSKIVDDYAGAE